MTALAFHLPPALEAHEPPEARGLSRDGVRMMVSRGANTPEHRRFRDIPDILDPGDLVVVNTSATLPAAVSATRAGGAAVELHFSTRMPSGLWVVEVRSPAEPASLPLVADLRGERLALDGGGAVEILLPYAGSRRLWLAAVHTPRSVAEYLATSGRPIRYGYVDRDWPLEAYQTVYATMPGSAEMPSAGRAFTPGVITALVARGIGVTPLTLHTGVASLEEDEAPYPETYRVPPETALRVNATRAAGRRVVAVGTTTVRALESVADGQGTVHPGRGWTDLVLGPDRAARAVDGLLTGWHAPKATHLLLLEALAERSVLETAYREALEHGYLWHEFGDLQLIIRGV